MRRLWTPWRMTYLVSDHGDCCVFCLKLSEDSDRDNLILYRGRAACVVMNLYPYNTGHLMIIPNGHVPTLEDLPAEAADEVMKLIQESLRILREVLHPDGFNVGANIGKSAGAGIHEHVHIHLVPRWDGDTNFMPIFAETRVMPEMLQDTYDRLKRSFDQLPHELIPLRADE
jgi:ATP adenylyltransferase